MREFTIIIDPPGTTSDDDLAEYVREITKLLLMIDREDVRLTVEVRGRNAEKPAELQP